MKNDWKLKRDQEQAHAREAARRANEYLEQHGFEARVVLYPLEKPDAA